MTRIELQKDLEQYPADFPIVNDDFLPIVSSSTIIVPSSSEERRTIVLWSAEIEFENHDENE